jgi:glutaredoxin-like protein NrdH
MPEPSAQLVLYTQAGCADSRKVRSWLTERGAPFTERDVSTDPDAAEALASTGIFATPLLVLGDTKVLGYRPNTLCAALTCQPSERGPPLVSESRDEGVR